MPLKPSSRTQRSLSATASSTSKGQIIPAGRLVLERGVDVAIPEIGRLEDVQVAVEDAEPLLHGPQCTAEHGGPTTHRRAYGATDPQTPANHAACVWRMRAG